MDSDNGLSERGAAKYNAPSGSVANNKRRTQAAHTVSPKLDFSDLSTEQQDSAISLLSAYVGQLLGDAVGRNLQAARQQSLLNLVTHGDAGYLLDSR